MSTAEGGGNIVTDGLILCLDAANSKSIVSGSTTWNDLSRGGNNGALTNGPTFSSANGGSIVFDGTNNYVTCGNASSLQSTIGSVSAWVKTTTPGNNYRSIIAKQNSWGLFIKDSILITYDWGNIADRTTGINISDSTWKNVAMTFTETTGTPLNNVIIYLNGTPVLTTTVKYAANNVNVEIGRGGSIGEGTLQFINGSISQALLYNKVLTSQEILQNYNATKNRFGL